MGKKAQSVEQYYRQISFEVEYCFNVETSAPLTEEERKVLIWLLKETFEPKKFGQKPLLDGKKRVVEAGPRMNFATPFSTCAVEICHACGLDKVTRVERSRRHVMPAGTDPIAYATGLHDRMTEEVYPSPITTFQTGRKPEAVFNVQLIEKGPAALRQINKDMGLGMDEWDIKFYTDLFVQYFRRNPTNVECFQLGQANSEHSRHWYFKGKIVIDGQVMPESLLEVVQSTLKANPGNSVIAFKDNSSGIKGFDVWTIIPVLPGECSWFEKRKFRCDIIFTAETHNFPSGVAPRPGAETGTGGRIRDIQATGRGGLMVAGTIGYVVGCLNLPDHYIPGEVGWLAYPPNLASPIKILIEASNGATDYGNKIGEPVILGFVRTGVHFLPIMTDRGIVFERRENPKPILFTGGIGWLDHLHIEKGEPEKGMLIVQIGGPAYRIGMGGGSASSMIQGQNKAELDFNAVQRGDPMMENKMNRVIRACVEMGSDNPVITIHDQGAGGPCNVLTELVNPAGGRIKIRNIILGDQTLSAVEIWGAEYQERNALLIWPERLEKFRAICQRENVNCEDLGEITDDGRVVLYDSETDTCPVDLELEKILGQMPQKTFEFESLKRFLQPLKLPADLTVEEALKMVFLLTSVGSKEWTVNKGDFSVTGLVANRQIDNRMNLPVNDVAVIAQSHFGKTGAATAIGEQQVKMLLDPKAGARMAVAEALLNLVWAKIASLKDVKFSANWMWAAKQPGEGAEIYNAANAMRDLIIKLKNAVDGGKDSITMAAKVMDEIVKAAGELVISAYAPVPDIRLVINPDLKKGGSSCLIFIDLTKGKMRLGGSALAQAHGQLGDECPDIEDDRLLARTFKAVQKLVKAGLILAGHDRSDGGLITTLVEMAISGNRGMEVDVPGKVHPIPWLFNEEAGLVIEVDLKNQVEVLKILKNHSVPCQIIGLTRSDKQFIIRHGSRQGKQPALKTNVGKLTAWWQATSIRLEREQANPENARQLYGYSQRPVPVYRLTFDADQKARLRRAKPEVAIIRAPGHNGDREMTSAFYLAGFNVWDVTLSDIINRSVQQDMFQGVVFVGGFSYLDVFDSAKGEAGVIRFNPVIKRFFDSFYDRADTFSLGVCNGCQLMPLLGWVPWDGIHEEKRPRFTRNVSNKFESRWSRVKILPSPSIMLKGMAGSILGTYVAHGEGRLYFPDPKIKKIVLTNRLAPLAYVDDSGRQTEQYPFNPNGSVLGLTALCSPCGRHLAMMNHIERGFKKWQWAYMPDEWKKYKEAPWMRAFRNAREWCDNN